MTLTSGARLGAYEIVGPLGAGGMGEVWRARDPRLGRDVAIKLLPEAFANDPDRLARFEREARLLASLHHANIAVLHGLEESGGRRFLVMECVEGGTLGDRLKAGPLPLEETLEIARAVAAALEAAHESGVVHRDLKPGNVMVTPAGEVKVLDFGLARSGAGAPDANVSASPTMTYAATSAGMILGTAAYMSPEQARGKAVDRRTDIWSFGCVLYECLSRRQAFAGETVSDIVACILQTEPDWTALPGSTPPRVRELLRRCLEKDVKRRLRDIGDARIELEDQIAGREWARAPQAVPPAASPARVPAWVVPALVALAAAGLTWLATRALAPRPPAEVARFELAGPRHATIPADAVSAQISPDGRTVAMIAADSSGVTHVYLRRLEDPEPRELAGTARATVMFWAPDSRSLAFFEGDEKLEKVALSGGDPEPVCDVKSARGGSWNHDGVMVLAPNSNGGIYRVAAGGGDLVEVTRPDSAHGEIAHRFPVFLPDGRHFVYVALKAGSIGSGDLCVGSLDGAAPRVLASGAETSAICAAPGWLVYGRRGVVVAQRFDAGGLQLMGDPVTLRDLPNISLFWGCPEATASATGTLAYVTREPSVTRFAWFDLQGHETAALPIQPGEYFGITLSTDHRRAAVQGSVSKEGDYYIAIADLDRGVLTRLTQRSEQAVLPQFSPDGNRIAYVDEADNDAIVVRSLVDGSTRRYLRTDHGFKRLTDWTHDGRALVYERLDPATKWDLWLLPLEGDSLPRPLVRTGANEEWGRVSPDGRWIAYQSDESGQPEVYVLPFGGAGMKYQVTNGGGSGGGWAPDGRRIFFASSSHPDVLLQAPVVPGAAFSIGPAGTYARLVPDAAAFDADLDHGRLLAVVPAEKARPQTVTLVQNWTAALPRP